MAAEIIAVTQQKGGVGKSTIAMHLGAAFHEKGKRVLVVDADGQNTLIHWASASSDGETGIPFPVVNLSEAGSQIHREIKKFVADYDIIVVDCPPSSPRKCPASCCLQRALRSCRRRRRPPTIGRASDW